MKVEVRLPSLGDGDDAVTGASVSCWLAKLGDCLEAGDDLLEVTTDKAAFVVPCPQAGTVAELCVSEDDRIAVGDLLCLLNT